MQCWKKNKIQLELLTDIDMYNLIMKGIKGGLVQCSKRHSIAYNKYLKNDYEKLYRILRC